MGKIVLVTGGARSGKSSWALTEANRLSSPDKLFIATAEPFDDEMKLRIRNHQQERGQSWQTVEAPVLLAEAIQSAPPEASVIVDCCTVWLGNIWHRSNSGIKKMQQAINNLIHSVEKWRQLSNGTIFIISNEVGWGIVPHDAGVRLYRDVIGAMNQQIAAIADEVYLCVAGIAVCIKPNGAGK